MATQRINRPKEAADILIRLSRSAFTMAVLLWLFTAITCTIGLWAYGLLVVVIVIAFTGIIAVVIYWLTLALMVEFWQRVQFYHPPTPKRLRRIPVTQNGKTTFIEVDRWGRGVFDESK